MSKIKLLLVNEKYIQQCQDYKDIMLKNNSSMDGCGSLKQNDVKTWIKESKDYHRGKNVQPNMVPATQLIAVDEDEKVVGMLQIRHSIEHEYLGKFGGHIGYSVRCDERRKGYAKQMLKQSLYWCKKLGIKKVLITCKKENIASSKTILSNGGIFEREVQNGDNTMLRYWIDIK